MPSQTEVTNDQPLILTGDDPPVEELRLFHHPGFPLRSAVLVLLARGVPLVSLVTSGVPLSGFEDSEKGRHGNRDGVPHDRSKVISSGVVSF